MFFISTLLPKPKPHAVLTKSPKPSIDRDSEAANIIEKNTCGWVVEPENEQQLIDSMTRALTTDGRVLKKMGDNSLEYAITHLSKKSNLRRLVSIIEEANGSQVQC